MSSVLKTIVLAAVVAAPVAVEAQVRASSAVVSAPAGRTAAPARAAVPARTGATMEDANHLGTLPIVLGVVGLGLTTAAVARLLRSNRPSTSPN